MATPTINLPLYQVSTELKVPEDRARQASEASIPDLSAFATRDDLKGAVDGLKGSQPISGFCSAAQPISGRRPVSLPRRL